MSHRPGHLVAALAVASALAPAGTAVASVPEPELPPVDMLLVDGELRTHRITEIILDARGLTFNDGSNESRSRRVETCIALAQRIVAKTPPLAGRGLLVISDGQRLPGTMGADAPAGTGHVAWDHPWLGAISVPLERVSAVLLQPTSAEPRSTRSDVIELINGDRLEGFVTSLADPIVIEIDIAGEQQEVRIPLERAAAVALVTPRKSPEGRRVWLTDGSVLDIDHLAIGDDGYVRLRTAWVEAQKEPNPIVLENVSAVLFDPLKMVPLTNLSPAAAEGPPTRYAVPAPRILVDNAPLGLSGIEYRGPMLVRYVLPHGATRFAAEAKLDGAARPWGDLELIIRDDDEEIYRRTLNGARPTDSINVAVAGSELTIELRVGANGPIQDHLVLERAMLLIER